MPRTIRNEFNKKLTYPNLMKAHILSRKGKGYRNEIISRKIQDEKLLAVIKQIIYSTEGKKGQPIRKLHVTNICQYISKWTWSICKT